MSEPIDIILPVYRDLAATERAIRAVLDAPVRAAWHLIVLNDASPEAGMPALLARLCEGRSDVTLLTNDENLGFVKTVNRALSVHEDRDAVILNSDTMVYGDWLDRLIAHAGDDIASITPFSNHATICSTPKIGDDNPDLADPPVDGAVLDALHARANAGASVAIPTGVGFCMWMSRRAMQAVGLFDAQAFGRGYGEESDWCMRAAAAGYRHLLACDVFVYHEGGSSFGKETQALKTHAGRLIRRRWPHYEPAVSRWVKTDPALPYRLAVLAARWKRSGLPVVLHVTHQLGGGTEKYLNELCGQLAEAMHHLILSPAPQGGIRLRSARAEEGLDRRLHGPDVWHLLTDALHGFGVSRMHMHHLLGFDETALRQMILALGVPFEVTLHDHYLLCPQLYLCRADGTYCGEPDAKGCNACIAERPAYGASDIDQWRDHYGWWLHQARRVIAPSADVAARVRRYHPGAPVIVMAHPQTPDPATSPRAPTLDEQEPLRVVILGVLSWHKGAARLRAVAAEAAQQGLMLEIHHLGHATEALPPRRQARVHAHSHGAYEEDALPDRLADINPHLIWFPGTCVETFSYTLSQAKAYGAPLWVPALGPFPERTAETIWTFMYSPDASPAELAQQLADIRIAIASGEPPARQTTEPASVLPVGSYERDYLTIPARPAYQRPPGETRRVVGWLTHSPESPDACAVIRILQPLNHPAIADDVKLVPLSLEQVWDADIDVLLAARTTLSTPQGIARLVHHLHERQIPIVYELDDDILNLPESHPEHHHYQQTKPGIKTWLRMADEVVVSTRALAEEVAAYRPDPLLSPRVIVNHCDERLWHLPDEDTIRARNAASPLKVVYVGTPTHQPDFDAIAAAIKPVLTKHNTQLTLIGVHRVATAPPWVKVLEPPEEARAFYPAFVRWLQQQQAREGWQCGLAPLCNLHFNYAKSGLKFMEYGCLGLAGVYADLPPYRHVVTHGYNGLLAAADHPPAWADALDRLLSENRLRTRIGLAAYERVSQQHLLSSDTEWPSQWAQVLRVPYRAVSLAEPPLYAAMQLYGEMPPRHPWHLRALRHLYHRHAAHPVIRTLWGAIPLRQQGWLKQRLRTRLMRR